MNAAFDREALLDAFDQIGRAAVQAGTKLQIAVYGGSALMLASNFRFATEDVDVSRLEYPLPEWLAGVIHEISAKNGWPADWFNDGVAFHLSSLADHSADHLEFGRAWSRRAPRVRSARRRVFGWHRATRRGPSGTGPWSEFR